MESVWWGKKPLYFTFLLFCSCPGSGLRFHLVQFTSASCIEINTATPWHFKVWSPVLCTSPKIQGLDSFLDRNSPFQLPFLHCTGDTILALIYGSPHRLAMPIFLSLFLIVTPNLIACYLPWAGKAVMLLNCVLSRGSRCAGGVTGTVLHAMPQNWFYDTAAAPAPVYIYFIVYSGSCHSTANTGLFSLGTITSGRAFPMKLC